MPNTKQRSKTISPRGGNPERPSWYGEPASTGQYSFLLGHGVTGDQLVGLSKGRASEMIRELKDREGSGS